MLAKRSDILAELYPLSQSTGWLAIGIDNGAGDTYKLIDYKGNVKILCSESGISRYYDIANKHFVLMNIHSNWVDVSITNKVFWRECKPTKKSQYISSNDYNLNILAYLPPEDYLVMTLGDMWELITKEEWFFHLATRNMLITKPKLQKTLIRNKNKGRQAVFLDKISGEYKFMDVGVDTVYGAAFCTGALTAIVYGSSGFVVLDNPLL